MTDRLTLECPKCKKTGILRVSSAVGGRLSVKCPGCGTVFEQHLERRFSYRKIPLPWVFFGPASSEDLPYFGWLSDVSMTGCRVRTEKRTPLKGEWLNLEFKLDIDCSEIPDKECNALLGRNGGSVNDVQSPLIRVRAKVVWAKKFGENHHEFGTEFISIGDNARKMLSLYLYPHHQPVDV